MSDEIIHHYPPEILRLLIETLPLLCRSKRDLLMFFQGAGVSSSFSSDLRDRVAIDSKGITKYEIVREILIRLNDKGEKSLRERREIIKRVVEWEDFSITGKCIKSPF